MPDWDSSLPHPILQSYHTADVLPVLRTQMQSGPPRMVRYSDHYLTTGQMTLVVNPAQLLAFRAMVDGANLGTDWINNTPIDTGGGLTAHRIRIRNIQRKVITPPDLVWQITITFETDDHL